MTSGLKKKEIDITPDPIKPIITLMLICTMPLFLCDNKTNWIATHAFTPKRFLELSAANDWSSMVSYLWNATFGQLSPWLFVFNAFFVWIFGSLIEQKLISWRYPVFVIVGVYAPWYFVSAHSTWDVGKMYIGPTLFLCWMLGGYLAYLPKKPFKPADWFRPPWKIFRDEEVIKNLDRYWVSPWIYISAFVIFVVLLQVSLGFSKEQVVDLTKQMWAGKAHEFILGKFVSSVNALAILPAVESILGGAVCAYILASLHQQASARRPGGALQVKVLQHYKELRALDMTHDQAIDAAAKFTSVPIEIARDWINKGAAALKDQGKQ